MKGNVNFEMQIRDREIDKLREQIAALKVEALTRHAKYAQTSEFLSKAEEQISALKEKLEATKPPCYYGG